MQLDLNNLKSLLLIQGADLNHADYFGRTGLHVAAGIQGSLDIVKFLTEQPIFLDLLDNSGRSALFVAIERNNIEVADHLCSKGATAIGNDDQFAKILCVAGFKGNLQQLKIMQKCEVNLEFSDYDLRNVGHLAACEGHYDVLEYLAQGTKFNFYL